MLTTVTGCGDDGETGVTVGSRAPAFTLRTADGSKVTRDSLQGRVVVLNFWSTRCGPCVEEMPELQRVEDGNRATVIGVALDEGGWDVIKPFLARHHVTYRVALGDQRLFERFDGIGIPYTLVLDREQRVARVYRSAVTWATLERDIGDLTN
jgi:cytochrome c biogenesis protein CcmG/thiol:disulfide interchange protein DsbE